MIEGIKAAGRHIQGAVAKDLAMRFAPRLTYVLDETLKKQALYGQAKSQMEAKQYPESIQSLTLLTRLQPDYEDVPALLKQARTRIIEQHYTQGVRFYREEKLKEAIAEWRLVLEIDPNHANARRNIDQAEKLLRGLEQRMKK